MNVLNKTERKKTESAWHDEWVSGKSKEVVFYDTPEFIANDFYLT